MASASPIVISGPSGAVAIHDTVSFSILDTDPSNGITLVPGIDPVTFLPTLVSIYNGDFGFKYDSRYLRFLSVDVPLSTGGLVIGTAPDMTLDPIWSVVASFITSDVLAVTDALLFSISFEAIGAKPDGTTLDLFFPINGAYGQAGNRYEPASGGVTINPAATRVPEPQSLALLAISGVAMWGARRRNTALTRSA